jgi:hypothetical protein
MTRRNPAGGSFSLRPAPHDKSPSIGAVYMSRRSEISLARKGGISRGLISAAAGI